MSSLIAELKRRNVFRVAVLYAIAAWLVLQITDVSVSLLGLPRWTGKLIFLLLGIGLPVALVLAWVYELTPDGIKPDPGGRRSAAASSATGRRLDIVIGVMAVVAIAVVVADRLFPAVTAPASSTSASASRLLRKPAATTPSIAVLPFVNMSDDPANAYFSEGISDELINSLCRLTGLRVIGRTSSFQFQGKPEDLRVIGAVLGVAHVLEGSVRKAGERVRITAQLVSTRDGSQQWSGSYDRELGDVFAVQDSIVDDVVKALRVELVDKHAVTRASKPSAPQAYALAMEGRYWLHRNSSRDLGKAEAAYREAIRLAPDYAPAWAGLAATYYSQTSYASLPTSSGLEQMQAAADKALTLDPDLAAGHHVMAMIQMGYDWDWTAARKSVDRALALAPGDTATIRQSGTLEMTLGNFDKAIELYLQSLDVDPLDGTTLNNLALAQYYAGYLPDAEASISKLNDLNPQSNGATYLRGLLQLASGRPQEALATFAAEPGALWKLQGQTLAYQALGQATESDAALAALTRDFGHDSAYQIAEAHAYRGEADAAFRWLERSYLQRDGGLSEIKGDPLLANLKSDPRYRTFLEKMKLPTQ